jgi:hypothetical protein
VDQRHDDLGPEPRGWTRRRRSGIQPVCLTEPPQTARRARPCSSHRGAFSDRVCIPPDQPGEFQ